MTKQTERKFVFWKYNSVNDTFIPSDDWVVVGISKNGSLRIRSKYNAVARPNRPVRTHKDMWIKEEYFSPDSEKLWSKTCNTQQYIIREVFPNQNISSPLAAVAMFTENNN